MDSQDIARYIEETNGISKPWLLVQLRLKKLQERRGSLSQQEYIQELGDIQQDLMKLGEWWRGILTWSPFLQAYSSFSVYFLIGDFFSPVTTSPLLEPPLRTDFP